MTGSRAVVDCIEATIHEEVGRNLTALFAASKGELWNAATLLASHSRPRVGLITGFFVPSASPPCAETDGPVGAALLAKGLVGAGVPCRLATDDPCQPACRTAFIGAGLTSVPIDSVAIGDRLDGLIATWRREGITHAIAIERCGRSANGTPLNMGGLDIRAHTAPLDELFVGGPWETIAIGDGGNEIGMGALSRTLIAQHVTNGEHIACVTPARHVIVAGVSNWGAYALLGALAIVRENWRAAMLACLEPGLDRAVLEAAVFNGPAVDGVTRQQALSVDGLPIATHHEKLRTIRSLVEAHAG